jgi:hypothetical protein
MKTLGMRNRAMTISLTETERRSLASRHAVTNLMTVDCA